MEIQIASLCDCSVDYQGKLCLLGAFDTIATTAFPAVHAQCAVALRILFWKAEAGVHSLSVRFVDDAGTSIITPVEASFQVDILGNAPFATRNMIFNLQQIPFARAGTYTINISIDKSKLASIPLQIALIEQSPAE